MSGHFPAFVMHIFSRDLAASLQNFDFNSIFPFPLKLYLVVTQYMCLVQLNNNSYGLYVLHVVKYFFSGI